MVNVFSHALPWSPASTSTQLSWGPVPSPHLCFLCTTLCPSVGALRAWVLAPVSLDGEQMDPGRSPTPPHPGTTGQL